MSDQSPDPPDWRKLLLFRGQSQLHMGPSAGRENNLTRAKGGEESCVFHSPLTLMSCTETQELLSSVWQPQHRPCPHRQHQPPRGLQAGEHRLAAQGGHHRPGRGEGSGEGEELAGKDKSLQNPDPGSLPATPPVPGGSTREREGERERRGEWVVSCSELVTGEVPGTPQQPSSQVSDAELFQMKGFVFDVFCSMFSGWNWVINTNKTLTTNHQMDWNLCFPFDEKSGWCVGVWQRKWNQFVSNCEKWKYRYTQTQHSTA